MRQEDFSVYRSYLEFWRKKRGKTNLAVVEGIMYQLTVAESGCYKVDRNNKKKPQKTTTTKNKQKSLQKKTKLKKKKELIKKGKREKW